MNLVSHKSLPFLQLVGLPVGAYVCLMVCLGCWRFAILRGLAVHGIKGLKMMV